MIQRTKAEMLRFLAPQLRAGRVLPLAAVRVADWQADRAAVLAGLLAHPFAEAGQAALIVRSSATGEDSAGSSLAGRFCSVAQVQGAAALAAALDQVVASYGDWPGDHQLLVQPMLPDVVSSGVAFSCDPATGAPYRVINLQRGDDTAAVTGGRGGGDLETWMHWHDAPSPGGQQAALLALIAELEALLDSQALDIEFAFVAGSDLPVLFQVRPLVLTAPPLTDRRRVAAALDGIARKISGAMTRKPYLHGNRTIFGVMPDWNPAEIIGIRPRPLALSLYRDLVTDSIWAYQRHNYGYKNLRSFPLLIDFNGLPYIDVRVSFNSFIPADIDDSLADRLTSWYLDRLANSPALHDKVEFEIVQSCYSFDLPDRMKSLPDSFSQGDRETLTASLRRLTNRIINRDNGLWQTDSARITELQQRRDRVMQADLDKVSRIYWLLEDCKRYGTLPFAGLARAGFIANQMLRSLVNVGVLSSGDVARFMGGLNTVSTSMGRDLHQLDRSSFLAKYGHLRPGTYDILSPRYDEAPDLYFNWADQPAPPPAGEPFLLSLHQMRSIELLLDLHGLTHHVVGLFDFFETSIRGREHAKFVFSRSLSDALSLFGSLGEQYGFSREDMSYADIGCIRRLYSGSEDPAELLQESIAQGRQRYDLTRSLLLPPLLTQAGQVWSFQQPQTEPNYITHRQSTGVVQPADPHLSLAGAILVLPNADPGYDWIFSRQIAGFVTAYGGVNSHMAIRASELGLPAVIGCGAALYQKWSAARVLRLDCGNRLVQVLQ